MNTIPLPPTPTISQAELVKNKVMNALGTDKEYDESYRGWITEEHYEALLTYYDTFVSTPHYVDKIKYSTTNGATLFTPENGTLMTKDETMNMAMDLCSNLYDQYVAIDYDPDQVVEIGGDVLFRNTRTNMKLPMESRWKKWMKSPIQCTSRTRPQNGISRL